MRRIATLAVTGILLAPCAAVAQSAATIRGQVYDCKTSQAMALATVELRNLDDGTTLAMQAANDRLVVRGRDQPARYLISATGPSLGQSPQYTRLASTT